MLASLARRSCQIIAPAASCFLLIGRAREVACIQRSTTMLQHLRRFVTELFTPVARCCAVRRYSPRNLDSLESRVLLNGDWTVIAHRLPHGDGAQTMMLLSDGTVMVHGGSGNASRNFYELTPNAQGSYVHGSWTRMPRMKLARLYYNSDVLTGGKVLVVGGEYSGPYTAQTEINRGEIYDPVAGTWTKIAPFPQRYLGDAPTEVLADGSVLVASPTNSQTYIYHPSSNTWTQTGDMQFGDTSSEEDWVKLPDGSILTYDISSSIASGVPTAQRYVPALHQWVSAGQLPVALSSARVGYELGAGVLLPDGRAFYLGATGKTAFYSSPTAANPTGSWTAGPVLPCHLAAGDAPAAVLPNGDVLMALSPKIRANPVTGAHAIYPSPTLIFEYNPASNRFTDVTPAGFGFRLTASFATTMLVLPTGHVLVCDDRGRIAVYTPGGSPEAAWRPAIDGIVQDAGGTFTLTGTQLNGLSEGAYYGDDNEMASNYPIVQLTACDGRVSYASTTGWQSLVATGSLVEHVNFTLPAAAGPGVYSVRAIANGIASAPYDLVVGCGTQGQAISP